MLISKDQFCHFVNRLKHCYEEQDKFHDAIKPFFDSPICNYMQQAIDGLDELLVVVSECEDEDDIFRWWIHECNEDNHILIVIDTSSGDETEYDVLTAEGLYTYLYDMYHTND